MKKLIALLLVVAVVMMVASCQQKAAAKPADTSATQDAAVTDIGNGISEVDNLNKDIDMTDLDTLDSDLANI